MRSCHGQPLELEHLHCIGFGLHYRCWGFAGEEAFASFNKPLEAI